MALAAEVGSFTVPGATGNQTVSLIDTGFGTVKALMLWGTYETAEADTAGHAIFCCGFGTYRSAAAQQRVLYVLSEDAGGVANTARGQSASNILRGFSAATTPTVDFSADLVSLGNAQFVVNWSDLPATASLKFHYLALGGSDLTDALADDITITSGAGTIDETVVSGFGQPDLILSVHALMSAASEDTAGVLWFAFGAGYDDANEAFTAMRDQDGAGTMTVSMAQKASLIGAVGPTAMDMEVELSARASWPTDGFQVNKVTAPGSSIVVPYLALKGTFSRVIGSNTVPTTGTPPVLQDLALGQTPRAAIFFHNVLGATAGVDSTSADLGMLGLGAIDGTRERWAAFGQDDGNATSVTHRHYSESKAIRMFTPSASGTLRSECDGSFSGTNVRLSWNDIDAQPREYRYLILGDASSLMLPNRNQAVTLRR